MQGLPFIEYRTLSSLVGSSNDSMLLDVRRGLDLASCALFPSDDASNVDRGNLYTSKVRNCENIKSRGSYPIC